jgi:hypothetical protein
MAGRLHDASMMVSAAALVAACLVGGAPGLAAAAGILAAGCLVAARRRRYDVARWGAASVSAVSGLAVLSGAPAGLALVSAVASLAAWDLGGIAERLAGPSRVEEAPAVERAHLRWLAATMAVGFVLAALAMRIRLSVSFALLAAFGLFVYLVLQRLASAIRGHGR